MGQVWFVSASENLKLLKRILCILWMHYVHYQEILIAYHRGRSMHQVLSQNVLPHDVNARIKWRGFLTILGKKFFSEYNLSQLSDKLRKSTKQ